MPETLDIDQYKASLNEIKRLEQHCSRCIESLFYYLPRTQNNFKAVETLNCARMDVTKISIYLLEQIKKLEEMEKNPPAMETSGA